MFCQCVDLSKEICRNNKIAPDAISDVNKYNLVYNNCGTNKIITYIHDVR